MRIFLDALSRIPTVSIGTQALIIGCLQILQQKGFPLATQRVAVNPIILLHHRCHLICGQAHTIALSTLQSLTERWWSKRGPVSHHLTGIMPDIMVQAYVIGDLEAASGMRTGKRA